MSTVKLFDCNVLNATLDETIKEIENIISQRKITQHVVLNASKVCMMKDDNRLKKIIQNCGIINADGQSIVWASQYFGVALKERVAGIDLMERLVEVSEKKGYSIYFLGAKQEVVQKVVEKYRYQYPNLKIAGYRNGYFNEIENSQVISEIRKSQADILFVAITSPKKEYWLNDNLELLDVPFCMGVGGSFDVVAGITKRAPLWMQKCGLEWFYRFIQEPKRLFKRYAITNTRFIWEVFRNGKNTK